jgi:hypothetical protein
MGLGEFAHVLLPGKRVAAWLSVLFTTKALKGFSQRRSKDLDTQKFPNFGTSVLKSS